MTLPIAYASPPPAARPAAGGAAAARLGAARPPRRRDRHERRPEQPLVQVEPAAVLGDHVPGWRLGRRDLRERLVEARVERLPERAEDLDAVPRAPPRTPCAPCRTPSRERVVRRRGGERAVEVVDDRQEVLEQPLGAELLDLLPLALRALAEVLEVGRRAEPPLVLVLQLGESRAPSPARARAARRERAARASSSAIRASSPPAAAGAVAAGTSRSTATSTPWSARLLDVPAAVLGGRVAVAFGSHGFLQPPSRRAPPERAAPFWHTPRER